ncbi:perlucin-like [Diabrotica virgifera virgifera]|uniref:C-type lectin domain-containing protein n=1 Tax=Diabrotica virgifera virgifera TaxID=50390 RepID=A0ABM5L6Q4_DIAVI|nr:perlucin-like [Diabrotica virgifera virgifera]
MERSIITTIVFIILFNIKMNIAYPFVAVNDTVINGDTIYYFGYTFKGNWFQAMQYCKSLDMDLIWIESKEENNFLYHQMKNLFSNKGEYWFWTSGTTLPHDKWVWMSTGRPIVFTNWQKNQPDNWEGKEHTLEVEYHYGKDLEWNDLDQDRYLNALCKVNIEKCSDTTS